MQTISRRLAARVAALAGALALTAPGWAAKPYPCLLYTSRCV